MVVPMISIFLIFTMSLQRAHGIPLAPIYDYHFCGSEMFTPNDVYQSNLNKLLTTLSSAATSPVNTSGFFNSSVTGSDGSTTVYGFYLCRGDVTAATCAECVSFAIEDVVSTARCSYSKRAVIWYDECTLRYSETDIFGSVQVRPWVVDYDSTNVSHPSKLSELLRTIVAGEMASQAANDTTSGKKFATKEFNLSSSDTVYSLVQCTPDLPSADCFRCINAAVSFIPSPSIGVKVLLPSCVVRYELYPFYNFAAPPAQPPVFMPLDSTNTTISTGKKRSWTKAIVRIAVPVTSVALSLAFAMYLRLAASKRPGNEPDASASGFEISSNDFISAESLRYDFQVLQVATNNFSNANKLGQGGFGIVYRGKLANGQEIAVKRLSLRSSQGAPEFKNEVSLVANLQHRNLVKLLGFCLASNEKLLVFEFVPNRSLDYFLTDPEHQAQLDWTRRYNIIRGIARGILYLHEDSRLRIIHRDIKPNNILLDADMTPKISDFGLATILGIQDSRAETKRVAGTFGYMAPEYASKGEFSKKSDVYSFGVVVLEIISGHKINKFRQSEYPEHLMSYAWKKWKSNEALEIMEPTLRAGTFSKGEVLRCIHLALLCVQEDANARPSMSKIVLTLSRRLVTLPQPRNPAFSHRTKSDRSSSSSVNFVTATEVDPR